VLDGVQGERNTRYITGMPGEPWYHRVAGVRENDDVLKGWMQRYRKGWGRDDFHFLMVMLPGFGSILNTGTTMERTHPRAHSWAWFRESQLAALDLPHSGVANTIDLGDFKNIHPKDKAPIGERLALLAAQNTLRKGLGVGPFRECRGRPGRLGFRSRCSHQFGDSCFWRRSAIPFGPRQA
jgi:sialate O-acetylesterase